MSEEEVKSLLGKANSALESKEFQKAIDICSKAIELEPKNSMCYLIQFLAEHKVTDIDQLENKKVNFDSVYYKNLKLYTNKKLFNELEAYLKKSNSSSNNFDLFNKIKAFFEPAKSNVVFPLRSKILFFFSYAPSFLFLLFILSREQPSTFGFCVLLLFVHSFIMFLNYKLLLSGRLKANMQLSQDTAYEKQNDPFDIFVIYLFAYLLGVGLSVFLVFVTLTCFMSSMFLSGFVLYAILVLLLFTYSKEIIPKLSESILNIKKL